MLSILNEKGVVHIITIFLGIILLSLSTVGVYYLTHKDKFSYINKLINKESDSTVTKETIKWVSYQESLDQGDVKPVSKILEVELEYNQNNNPNISILNLNKKNGYTPKLISEDKTYEVVLLNSRNENLFVQNFTVPLKMMSAPPLPGESATSEPIDIKTSKFTVTIPWLEGSTALKIINTQNQQVVTKKLDNISDINNKPSFSSVKGSEIINNNNNILGVFKMIVNKVLGDYTNTENKEILNITFIGDKFTNSNLIKFHSDINRMSQHLLTFEPFKTRASQIAFHFVDNTNDLGCSYWGRTIVCDNSKVTQAVNNSGVPYDTIMVVVNSSTYGGSAYIGGVATTYNGEPWGTQVFVHELGHSFGRLEDEYISNYPYPQTDKNCFNGLPPNSLWSTLINSNDYYIGCTHPNWYRSSQTSIMREINSYIFNPISLKWLNYYIDQYAGQLNSSTPTPQIINTPAPTTSNKATPTPVPTPTPSTPFVKITSPNGGEVLTVGDKYKITWSTNTQKSCSLAYIIGAYTSTFYNIANFNDGSIGYYDWTVSLPSDYSGSSAQVRVSITCRDLPFDESDTYLIIQKPGVNSTPLPTPVPSQTPAPTEYSDNFDKSYSIAGHIASFNPTTPADQQFIKIPYNSQMNFGGNNLTIEAWIKPNLPPGGYSYYKVLSGQYNLTMVAQDMGSSVKYYYYFDVPSVTNFCNQTVVYSDQYQDSRRIVLPYASFNSWKHIAGVVYNGNMYIYENGILLNSYMVNMGGICVTKNYDWIIGAYDFAHQATTYSDYFNGQIDEVRISNAARYTVNFTPIRKPFSKDANTVGLYHLNGNALDDSSKGLNGQIIGGSFVNSDI